MNNYAKIYNNPDLVRDRSTNAILSTNPIFIRRHEKRINDLAREETRTMEIQSLKTEIKELKNLLVQLIPSCATAK